MDTKQQFSKLTVSLHWIVAILMITLLALGLIMVETHDYSLYPLHKSLGVLVLVFALVRSFWRMKNGWPVPASSYKAYEHMLAGIVHWILILGTLIMPLSGVILSSMSGHEVPFFGFDIIPANHDPANPQDVLPRNKALSDPAGEVHEIVGWLLIGAVAFHVVGALKHHIIDKDGTLRRMLGQRID